MKLKPLFTLLFIINVGILHAQSSIKTMSLKDAVLYALNNNTQIKQQNLTILKSKFFTKEITSNSFPQINGTAQFTDNLKIQEQLLPGEILGQPGVQVPVEFGVQYAIPLSVRWDQILYNKAYFVSIEHAKQNEVASQKQLDLTKENVMYDVATSYFQTIIIQEQQNIIEANLLKLSQSVNVAKIQYQNQMIRKIDLDQLIVNETNTMSELINSQISYSQSLDLFKIIIGYPINDSLELSDKAEFANFIVPENSTSLNPTLSVQQIKMNLKSLEIKEINSKYVPSLSGFAQYGYQSQFSDFSSSSNSWNSNSVVGLSLNIPIFDGLQKKRQVQQKQLELKSMELENDLLNNQINVQYQNAVRNYNQNILTVNNQSVNYELAQNVYDAIQINYTNGIASLSDLINADSSLKGAQTQYLTALLQKGIAALNILKANGNMNYLTTIN